MCLSYILSFLTMSEWKAFCFYGPKISHWRNTAYSTHFCSKTICKLSCSPCLGLIPTQEKASVFSWGSNQAGHKFGQELNEISPQLSFITSLPIMNSLRKGILLLKGRVRSRTNKFKVLNIQVILLLLYESKIFLFQTLYLKQSEYTLDFNRYGRKDYDPGHSHLLSR